MTVPKISLTTPLLHHQIESLKPADLVLISGVIYTARDAAHKKMYEALLAGESLPLELANQIIFYAGPTPPKPHDPIGSIGPTTGSRMNKFTPLLLQHGLTGIIGKGPLSQAVDHALIGKGCYFVTYGGAAVILAHAVRDMELIAYPELGTEAIYRLTVHDFPCIVATDMHGNSIFNTTT